MVKSKLHSNSQRSRSAEDSAPGRRERRTAETRLRLFRSALDLFAKKGFVETTVEDITDAADVGKGTFFNYFPSKDHILLAFGEMQLAKLEAAISELRQSGQSMPEFLHSLALRMTQEPIRNPAIVRVLLQAYLSTTAVRAAMQRLQARALTLHIEIVQLGQERGEIRRDLPAAELAHIFRQTIFGTLLFWSLHGDATLHERIDSAFRILWSGLAPREEQGASTSPLLSTLGD